MIAAVAAATAAIVGSFERDCHRVRGEADSSVAATAERISQLAIGLPWEPCWTLPGCPSASAGQAGNSAVC